MNKMCSIEQLINMNCIKYNRMIELTNEAFAGSSSNELNVFLDLYSMLKILYKDELYRIEDYSLVTSSLINLVAHYRNFFREKYHVETKFYLIYSENTPYANNQFIAGYNAVNAKAFTANAKIRDMILNNMDLLLNTLCPYLPDIFYFKKTFETGVVIQDIIYKNQAAGNNAPNLIITKDIYNYQLATNPNVIIFRPMKYKGEDCSYYINMNNVFAHFFNARKITVEPNTTDILLHPKTLSLVMALSKMPERNIKSLYNIKTALKMISKAIEQRLIMNGYNADPMIVYNALMSTKVSKKNVPFIEFQNRFKAIDIEYQQRLFMNSPESKMDFPNLYDPDGVRAINNKYFKTNPLDLNRL